MSNAGREPKPYPYTIPHATCPNPATMKKLDAWHVQEFFRIELLLRSRIVMEMYQPEDTALDSPGSLTLMLRYGFGWCVTRRAVSLLKTSHRASRGHSRSVLLFA